VGSVAAATIGITPFIMAWLGFDNLTHWQMVGVSALLVVASTVANLLGVRIVAWLNNASVVAELSAAALIIVGLVLAFIFNKHAHVNSVHYLFTTDGTVKGSVVLPLLFASLFAVFVVSAFDVSGTAGEETKNAARAVPTAAIAANAATWLIGTVVLLVLVLGINNLPDVLGAENPVGEILRSNIAQSAATVFTVLAVFALWINAVILQLAGARVIWAQARDGHFPAPRLFARLNHEKIPYAGVILGGVIAIALTVYSSLFAVLIAMLAIAWAGAYGVLLVIGYRTRLRNKLPERPFTVRYWRILYPVCIIWSFVVVAVLIYQDPIHVGIGTVGAGVIGIVVYYLFVPNKSVTKMDLAAEEEHCSTTAHP
jgi:amino acid transporter